MASSFDPSPTDGAPALQRLDTAVIEAATGRRRALANWVGRQGDTIFKRLLKSLFYRRGIPYMSPAELERALGMIRIYTDPAVLADPDRLMAPPPGLPRPRARWRRPVRGGMHSHLVFDSPYRPVHRVYAAEYRRYDRLDTVHLFAWNHTRPAVGSIIITHGWGVGSKWLHHHEFGIDSLFRQLGLDVYYYVMPFHSLRRPTVARFSGELHPSPNLMRTNEAFIQTAQELRSIMRWIKSRSPAPLGMMGSSLGGYTTALLASLEESLDFAIPVLAPASLAEVFWEGSRGDTEMNQIRSMGMTQKLFVSSWALHSPLSYQPKVPWRARFIIGASGDHVVQPRHVDQLWEHWGRPRRYSFAGGHILQFYRRDYHHQLGRFLVDIGVRPVHRAADDGRGLVP